MLPSINRLTRKDDFLNVRQNGKFQSNPLFSVSWVKRTDPPSLDASARQAASRFGFVVSKKVSMKAHERNRIKRILREVVRKNIHKIKPGQDFVFIAKPGMVHATSATIETQIESLFK